MNRDPIENTKEFKEAMRRIQPELDMLSKQLDEQKCGLGSCHLYWSRKKELLKALGIDWKTPAECNLRIIFD